MDAGTKPAKGGVLPALARVQSSGGQSPTPDRRRAGSEVKRRDSSTELPALPNTALTKKIGKVYSAYGISPQSSPARQRKTSGLGSSGSQKLLAATEPIPSVVPILSEIKELARREESAESTGMSFMPQRVEPLQPDFPQLDEKFTPLYEHLEPRDLPDAIPELGRLENSVELPRDVRAPPPLPPPAQYERPMDEALAGTF